jgi:chromosome segregation protein
VLDEVDAALDDINVARLLRLLQELSQQEQFVVITHNKHTMKVMQRLVGVVTQPRGISRVLEVTLKQAESYVGSEAQ